jgi:Ion channel
MRRVIAPSWHPAAVLLTVQLVGVVVFPFLEETVGQAALQLFGLVILAIAVRAVQASPAITGISIGLGVPIVVLVVLQALDPSNTAYQLWVSVLLAAFYAYTSYALIRYLVSERTVTADTLLAAGATFTVVAWAFAYVFAAVQIVWPGAFSPAAGGGPQDWFALLFLSFTNLTSVGLSDIVPVLGHSRSLVMVEQVAGVLYIALVVARLVGLTVARAANRG